jgi:hypothetical protein
MQDHDERPEVVLLYAAAAGFALCLTLIVLWLLLSP